MVQNARINLAAFSPTNKVEKNIKIVRNMIS